MKLPNWFKIFWWVLILLLVTVIVIMRGIYILNNNPTFFDTTLLILWISLLLVPIFSEINIFGVSLKQELKELTEDINKQINSLKSEVKTSIQTDFSPQITLPYLPPDSQLPKIKEEIKSVVRNVIEEHKHDIKKIDDSFLSIDEDAVFLFQVRLSIEKEIRRIWDISFKEGWMTHLSTQHKEAYRPISIMLNELTNVGLLSTNLTKGIKEVYGICSPAIHGDKVSKAKIRFVEEIHMELINALKLIA